MPNANWVPAVACWLMLGAAAAASEPSSGGGGGGPDRGDPFYAGIELSPVEPCPNPLDIFLSGRMLSLEEVLAALETRRGEPFTGPGSAMGSFERVGPEMRFSDDTPTVADLSAFGSCP